MIKFYQNKKKISYTYTLKKRKPPEDEAGRLSSSQKTRHKKRATIIVAPNLKVKVKF
jgi:hypothetical protein